MLYLGCALLAFGPFVSLFGLIVYSKAQLVIVVTTAAFFFLVASLASGLFWYIFYLVGIGGAVTAIVPSVFFQFVCRCGFVALYQSVEQVIQASIEKHQREEERNRRETEENGGSESEPATDDTVRGRPRTHSRGSSADRSREKSSWTESAKLKLQLNDASCGIAAGVGYGGMHAIMLYGTLLASEMSHGGGILYQSSCPQIPSLVVSALYAFSFTVLDVFFMLFTFFGMRRRRTYHRGQHAENQVVAIGSWFGDSRNGGNLALLVCLVMHALASTVTMSNFFNYGCVVSLPLVAVIVLTTTYLFWAGVGRIYMPQTGPQAGPSVEAASAYHQSITPRNSDGNVHHID